MLTHEQGWGRGSLPLPCDDYIKEYIALAMDHFLLQESLGLKL